MKQQLPSGSVGVSGDSIYYALLLRTAYICVYMRIYIITYGTHEKYINISVPTVTPEDRKSSIENFNVSVCL